MTILSFFRELYALDTLDTRFRTSSRTPLKTDDSEPRKPSRKDARDLTENPQEHTPAKWNTPEFYLYAFVFVFCVPQMYWAVVQVSQRGCSRCGDDGNPADTG